MQGLVINMLSWTEAQPWTKISPSCQIEGTTLASRRQGICGNGQMEAEPVDQCWMTFLTPFQMWLKKLKNRFGAQPSIFDSRIYYIHPQKPGKLLHLKLYPSKTKGRNIKPNHQFLWLQNVSFRRVYNKNRLYSFVKGSMAIASHSQVRWRIVLYGANDKPRLQSLKLTQPPKIGWFEDDPFLLGFGNFSGAKC